MVFLTASFLLGFRATAAEKTTAQCLAVASECNAMMESVLMFSSSICMPNEPPEKRHAAVFAWLMAHKERARDDAVLTINDAARALWPCNKRN